MLFEKALPRLLEHVNTERLGRRAEVLSIVAQLSQPPYAVPIGPDVFRALGREPREARYDQDLLVRLADDHHALHRTGDGRRNGRRPDYWVVIPDIDRWRDIPWITPRPRLWKSFLGPLCGDDPRLWAKIAGKGLSLSANSTKDVPPEVAMLSVDRWSTTADDWSTNAATQRGSAGGLVHKRSDVAPPYSAFVSSKEETNSHSLRSFNEGKDRGGTEPPSEAVSAVIAAACDSHVWLNSIYGEPFRAISAVVEANPDKLFRFIAAAKTPADTINGVVSAILNASRLPATVAERGAPIAAGYKLDPQPSDDDEEIPPDPETSAKLRELANTLRSRFSGTPETR